MNLLSSTVKESAIQAGDTVLVRTDDDSTYLFQVIPGRKLSTHRGILPHEELVGLEYGAQVSTNVASMLILHPSVEEAMMKVKRRTNIVYPKEAAYICMKNNLRPGKRVLEIGVGSGALNLALVNAVCPGGRVYACDVREDFLELAQENFERSGIEGDVQWVLREREADYEMDPVDAVVLDIPTPWEEVERLKRVLKPGARLASLNPTVNQMEQMAETLRAAGYVMVEGMELLLRPWLPRYGKSRPVQHMSAHTEFLLFAVYAGNIE
ncbi:MAG: tRNA (adenine-N1)-methyltransferase [Candidatus Omnitrophica bacterium]|nr:tRNA (adenine-N1)-methyltransferase [Candidatus Omnitrophota bacterium]